MKGSKASHFVKWKKVSPVLLKLHLQKNLKIISMQKKFVYFDALRLSEAAGAVTTVCVNIFPILSSFLYAFSSALPIFKTNASLPRCNLEKNWPYFFGSYHFLIN